MWFVVISERMKKYYEQLKHLNGKHFGVRSNSDLVTQLRCISLFYHKFGTKHMNGSNTQTFCLK